MAMCAWAFDRSVNTVALIGTALVMAPTAWLLTRPHATSETRVEIDLPAEPRREEVVDADTDTDSRSAGSRFTAPQLRP